MGIGSSAVTGSAPMTALCSPSRSAESASADHDESEGVAAAGGSGCARRGWVCAGLSRDDPGVTAVVPLVEADVWR